MAILRRSRPRGSRIDYSLSALPKVRPAALERHDKQTEHDRKLAAAYLKVDDRDDSVCWVTGVKLKPGVRDDHFRREHHHLKGRNVMPEWVYRPERIITVSADVHKYLTCNALLPSAADARKPIYFEWNPRMVDPKRQPFRLRASVRRAA